MQGGCDITCCKRCLQHLHPLTVTTWGYPGLDERNAAWNAGSAFHPHSQQSLPHQLFTSS